MWEEYFYKRLDCYLHELKTVYLSKIEKAFDKPFAEKQFYKNLFEDCVFIPMHTVFFSELISRYNFNIKLGYDDFLQQTMNSLPEIQQTSSDALEDALFCFMLQGKPNVIQTLPKHYKEMLKKTKYTIDIIIQHERDALKKTDEEVVDMLALYQASQILANNFKVKNQAQKSSEEKGKNIKDTTKLKGWTRNQQVLFFYYLFIMAEMDRNNSSVTACAKVMHAMLGIENGTIVNSDIYKKLLNPLNQTSKKMTIKNLNFIKEYFLELNNHKALQLIEKDIQKLDGSK